MKKVINYLLIVFTIGSGIITLESCKKGSGDPGISLRSRKARVAGDWKVVNMVGSTKESVTTTNGSVYKTNTSLDFNGSKLTESVELVFLDTTETIEHAANWSFVFGKDGVWSSVLEKSSTSTVVEDLYDFVSGNTYSYTRTQNHSSTKNEAGKWDFLSGVGEEKKKESMYIEIETSVETLTIDNSYVSTEAGAPFISPTSSVTRTQRDFDQGSNAWKLTTLKNKNISVESASSYNYSETSDGDPSSDQRSEETSMTLELEPK